MIRVTQLMAGLWATVHLISCRRLKRLGAHERAAGALAGRGSGHRYGKALSRTTTNVRVPFSLTSAMGLWSHCQTHHRQAHAGGAYRWSVGDEGHCAAALTF